MYLSENIFGNTTKGARSKSLVGNRLCSSFIIISRFARSKNTFAMIASLSNLGLSYSKFILLV